MGRLYWIKAWKSKAGQGKARLELTTTVRGYYIQ